MTADSGSDVEEAEVVAALAAADLIDRAGATGFTLRYHDGDLVTWEAQAEYRGARLVVGGQPTLEAAATGLCIRLLTGAACKCGRKVSLRAGTPGCLWQLIGGRWTAGCDDPPVCMPESSRGDMAAMREALNVRVADRERRAS